MYKHFVAFFRFFLPIVRKAALEVAAEELTRLAYPNPYDRRGLRPRPRTSYSQRPRGYTDTVQFRQRGTDRIASVPRNEFAESHEARPDDDNEAGDRCKDCGQKVTWIGPGLNDWEHVDAKDNPFDGNVTVSFYITGPDADNVRSWLLDNMPDPGVYGEEDEIRLDSVQVNHD